VLSTLTTTTNVISGIVTTGIYVGMRMDGSPGMPANNYVTVVGGSSVTGTFNFTDNTTTNVTFSDQGATFVAATALTASQQNAINGVAYIPGGSSAVVYDIIKQEASRRYLVKTAQGYGQCKLVAAAPGAGEMNIIATDTLGSTYYVTKLTARRAVLTRQTDGGSGYEFATGAVSGWTINAASTGIVSIANA
jgi:hypothetical protein